MTEFKDGWAFIRYLNIVSTQYRFAYPDEVREFLQVLVDTSKSRINLFPVGSFLWRAQIGHATHEKPFDESDPDSMIVEHIVPFSPKRMKPRKNTAHEGRVNPKGIPCLYVASDQDTAMSEIRPWMGAKISLGKYQTTRDLKLVDFSLGHDFNNMGLLFGKPTPEEIQKGIWAQVDKSFSVPITDDLATAEYAPTQVIAEFFRKEGFDGLIYKSMLGKGLNMALFDLDCADLIVCSLFNVEKLLFCFKEEQPTI